MKKEKEYNQKKQKIIKINIQNKKKVLKQFIKSNQKQILLVKMKTILLIQIKNKKIIIFLIIRIQKHLNKAIMIIKKN